jgi:hypothetical protein
MVGVAGKGSVFQQSAELEFCPVEFAKRVAGCCADVSVVLNEGVCGQCFMVGSSFVHSWVVYLVLVWAGYAADMLTVNLSALDSVSRTVLSRAGCGRC